MITDMFQIGFALILGLASGGVPRASGADLPDVLKDSQILENLGATVSADQIELRNEQGAPVKLSSYFDGKRPVVLNLVYYGCPNLCTFVMNGLTDVLKTSKWTPGAEFEVVNVSIDPRENAKLATEKKAVYLQELGKPSAGKGWHFLTGDEAQVRRLAQELGFGYKWDPLSKQYAHAAGLFFLTGKGKVSRALKGIVFEPRDFRLALLEAGEGRIGTVIDQLVMFCFKYDPLSKGYSLYAFRLIQIGGALTLLVMGIYFFVFWRGQMLASRPGVGS